MARRPLRLLAALLAVALLGACGDDGGTEPDTGGEAGSAAFDTVEEGTLTVCADIPYPPFLIDEGGDLSGIEVDVMTAIAEDLDLEVEFRDTDFDGIFSALAAGNCDVIASSVSITEERRQNNDFTEGYFEINQSLLVRKADEAKVDDLPDLKGKTVGVQSETTGAAYAQEHAAANGYTVKEFTGADELLTALRAEQVDAVLQDFPINSYNAEQTGETVVVKTFDAEEKEEYGFVVKKGNTELLEALDAALERLRDEGEYDRILEKYLGEAASS